METCVKLERMESKAFIIPALHWSATALEAAGVLIIVGGAVVSAGALIRQVSMRNWEVGLRQHRAGLGRAILLGLELLVAADIIGTVAVAPSFQNLGVLGLIILIRTFLSFSLEVEIEGHWPWRRIEVERREGQKL
jgi:uncharacterized membrane protein